MVCKFYLAIRFVTRFTTRQSHGDEIHFKKTRGTNVSSIEKESFFALSADWRCAGAETQTGRERGSRFHDVEGLTSKRCKENYSLGAVSKRPSSNVVKVRLVECSREIFAIVHSRQSQQTDPIVRICPVSIDSVLPPLTWRKRISTSRFNQPTSRANRPSYPCPVISNIKWDGCASSPERLYSVVFGLVQRRQAKRKRIQRPVQQQLTSSEAFKRLQSPVTRRIRCRRVPFQPVMSSLATLGPQLAMNR